MASGETPATKMAASKPKILCLHGIGTNGDILEAQTSALRHHLGDGYEFDFVDGAHQWPAAPGIAEVFGPQQTCYSYFDGSAASALEAIDDLAIYITENGPFDAVLGFSMGAALAATLLLRRRCDDGSDDVDKPAHAAARSMVRSAILVCGTTPVDCDKLRRGSMSWLHSDQVGDDPAQLWQPVSAPTVHAWSREDTDHPGQSEQLVRMCAESGRIEVLHSAGHGFPSKTDEVVVLAGAVREMLYRLGVHQ